MSGVYLYAKPIGGLAEKDKVTYVGEAFDGQVKGWPAMVIDQDRVWIINVHGFSTMVRDLAPGDTEPGWPDVHPNFVPTPEPLGAANTEELALW